MSDNPNDNNGSDLVLTEWALTLNYLSYYDRPVGDIRHAAIQLVANGFAVVSVASDGYTAWAVNGQLMSGQVHIGTRGASPTGKVRLPEPTPSFVRRAHLEAASRRFSQIRLFGQEATLVPPFVRATMAPCYLGNGHDIESHRLLQPIVTIFATGDVIVSLRVISEDLRISGDEFVRNHLCLTRREFDNAVVPRRLLEIGARLGEAEPRWFQSRKRRARVSRISSFDRELRAAEFEIDVGEVVLTMASVAPGERSSGAESVASLANRIIDCAAYEIGDENQTSRDGARLRRDAESFWFGRPHVHLIRFDGQAETASGNEEQFGDAIGRIMIGLESAAHGVGRSYLPQNLRTMGEYGVYINESLSLWVWATKGLESGTVASDDAHRGRYHDEHAVQGDLLSFGHIVHRRLYHAARKSGPSESVLRAQHDVIELEGAIREATHFGELRDFLAAGLEKMGTTALRDATAKLLAIQKDRAQLVEARRQSQWQTLLTVFFGMLAVPTIADQVLRPAWAVLDLERPADEHWFTLLITGVAIVLVAGILLGFVRVLRSARAR